MTRETSAPDLWLLGGRIIDGTGNEPTEHGYVHVSAGRIQAVGEMAGHRPGDAAEAERIDLDGRCLLPGLIDCHAHLVYSGFTTLDALDRCPLEMCTINAVLNARKVLEAGYTTVRDVGTVGNVAVTVRDAVDQGKVPGPRIIASGQILCPTAGMVDNLPPHWSSASGLGAVVDGPDEIRKTIRRQIKNGVDNIKLGASGVEVGPYAHTWMTTFSEAEIHVAVEEAHRWGRSVAVHAQSYDAVKFALRAGADTIEHGTRMDDEAIDLFRRSKSFLVPTLCTLFSVLELGEKLNLVAKQRAEMAINEPLWLESLRRAREAGIPIAAGGDLGNRIPHGKNARELEYLVRAGMTPLEAIKAATGDAARALKRDADLGTVAPGKVADLVVFDGDPLSDIGALQDGERVHLVFKDGLPAAGRMHRGDDSSEPA
jgi:imidazolonepropionase-like amidohydrolase